MVNENIHNRPFEKFVNKDKDVVVVLMKAHGSKQHELWRPPKQSMNQKRVRK
jgi:hypothetical protein